MLSKIKEDVSKVIACSQNYNINPEEMNVGPLIHQWFEAKRGFIEALDGKCILEVPNIVFSISEESKKEAYKNFQSMAIEWVIAGEAHDALLNYFKVVSYEEFFNNKINKDFNCGSFSIKSGTKFVKSLKHFFTNPNLLDTIQTEASRLIQEDKIRGTLCFSVHPLDYLSSSENCSNWRSCHSLDGEYRAGNLAYMTDDSTVICYLKSENEKNSISNFPNDVPWNNKKWRCLLYFDENWKTVYAGRQYPFTCDLALPVIKEKLLPLVSPVFASGWSDWSNFTLEEINGIELHAKYHLIRNKLYVPFDIIKPNNGLFFNDVICGTNFTPSYMYDKFFFSRKSRTPYFNIGCVPLCPVCGKSEITISDLLICDECACKYNPYWKAQEDENEDEYCYCEECGAHIHNYNEINWVEGIHLCADCAEELSDWCDNCGERFFKENLAYCPEMRDVRCRNCGGKFEED